MPRRTAPPVGVLCVNTFLFWLTLDTSLTTLVASTQKKEVLRKDVKRLQLLNCAVQRGLAIYAGQPIVFSLEEH